MSYILLSRTISFPFSSFILATIWPFSIDIDGLSSSFLYLELNAFASSDNSGFPFTSLKFSGLRETGFINVASVSIVFAWKTNANWLSNTLSKDFSSRSVG